MRSLVLAAAATFISSAYATPWGLGGLWGGKYDPTQCLCEDSATYLVNGFASLISAYNNATANAILANNLVDYSDSILSLQGLPLGGPAFPSKAAFEAGQGAQPAVPFNVIAIESFNCDTIAFRWNVTLPPNPVKGITILKASNSQGQKNTWQISTIFTEFNSIAWLQDIGGSVTFPSHA